MEKDINFLRAQNEFLKEKLAKLSNEVFMLREALKHKQKDNGKKI